MSAAVRPAAALLRRARYAPVTQCLHPRWQSSAPKPATYEDMLDLLESEYATPEKRRLDHNPHVPSNGQHASNPASAPPSDDHQGKIPQQQPLKLNKINPNEQGRMKEPPVKPSFQRSATANGSMEQEPRRKPAPVYKTSEAATGRQAFSQGLSSPRPPPSDTKLSPTQTTSTTAVRSESNDLDGVNVKSEIASTQSLAQSLERTDISLMPFGKTGKGKLTKPFDNIFLRDSCTCSLCVDSSTRQKRFDSADIPANIKVRSVEYHGHDVVISWKHDVPGFDPEHRTRLDRRFLKRACIKPVTHSYAHGKFGWNKRRFEAKSIDFDYNEYMSDEKVFFQLLQQLHALGLVFIKNVPETESAVIDTANRIGPLKNTFYGNTWDVRSVSNAKNVAYTDVHLGFHMDLLYMQQPPRLQLLHCLRASTQGGVSLFSDSYKAAQALSELDFDAFQTLVDTPVNFHYDNDNHHYFRSRPTFQLREGVSTVEPGTKRIWTNFEAVNWAPPFQAPFDGPGAKELATKVRKWHEAAQLFRNLTETESVVYRRQMAPGECVIFDNRRVLHARTAFAGGERWLRGAYIDDDPYLSKIRVLERTYDTINGKFVWYGNWHI